ncbi:MAG: cytochrome C [Pseudomonadota bacterium]
MTKIIGLLIAFCMPLWVLAEDSVVLPANDASGEVTQQTPAKSNEPDPSVVEKQQLSRFANRPPPEVPRRQHKLTFYPCSQCHKFWKTNPVPHKLAPVHRVGLNHGQNRFWCLTCHDADNRDLLRTEQDGKVGFNKSWRVCGQCHANRQRDWYFGAHGKRANDWSEAPKRYNCTHCHDPHFPPFEQKKPQPKPPVRAGLEPMKNNKAQKPNLWERHGAKSQEAQDD